jgi:beta-aspartyl-peptidase (threonine type)
MGLTHQQHNEEAILNRPVIIVHGGAWYVPDNQRDAYIGGCRQAAAAGWDLLQAGAPALDAVEAAVRILEDDPTYDAGRGSYFNRDGQVELDAIMMDGRALDFGAVAAVQHVRHPISLARMVLERCEHSFVVGPGAEALAASWGVPRCDPADLLGVHDAGGWSPPALPFGPGDTVGAAALDRDGNLVVGTSTGGTPDKWPGRVGDSPLVGCGAYADNLIGAAAATGSGEALMRIVTSKAAVDLMGAGLAAQAAADAVIARLWDRVRGYGGVIMIDKRGSVGLAHNTPNLSFAYVTEEGGMVSGVEAGDAPGRAEGLAVLRAAVGGAAGGQGA